MYDNAKMAPFPQQAQYQGGGIQGGASIQERNPDAVREKLTQILWAINNSHCHADDISSKLWGLGPAVMDSQGNKSLSEPPVVTLLDLLLNRVNELQQKLQAVSVLL